MKLWIARDKDRTLVLHFYEPKLYGLRWISLDYKEINENLFPEVTFENSPKLKFIK